LARARSTEERREVVRCDRIAEAEVAAQRQAAGRGREKRAAERRTRRIEITGEELVDRLVDVTLRSDVGKSLEEWKQSGYRRLAFGQRLANVGVSLEPSDETTDVVACRAHLRGALGTDRGIAAEDRIERFTELGHVV